MPSARGVVLTGLPGVGKTTACRRVAQLCLERGVRVEGFLTEELREQGARVGFDVVSLGDGEAQRAPLARVTSDNSGPRVGRYSVFLREFESLVFPILDDIAAAADGADRMVGVVDEIGKMELFSTSFVDRVRRLFRTRPMPLVFTVALHGGGLISQTKSLPEFDLIELTRSNRDDVPADIVTRLLGSSRIPSAPTIAPSRGSREQESALLFLDDRRPSRWRRRIADADPARAAPEQSGSVVTPGALPCTPPHPSASSEPEVGEMSKKGGGEGARAGACARVVVWLRNELRLGDNPLLEKAVAVCQDSGAALLPTICLDPREFGANSRTEFGSPKIGDFRRVFLEESLADLQASLLRCGSQLLVCETAPEVALPAIAGDGGVVYASREACPEEAAAEARCAHALGAVGARLELLDTADVGSLFTSEDLRTVGLLKGTAFPEDFQIFYRAVRNSLVGDWCQGLHGVPQKLPSPGAGPASVPAGLRGGKVALWSTSSEDSAAQRSPKGLPFRGGESQGLARMRAWLSAGGLRRYKTTFRRLMGDYSSRLSAHLALGCISPRRLVLDATSAAGTAGFAGSPHLEHFLYELCWRDFFRNVARRWGAKLFRRDGPLGDTRHWRRDIALEERWKQGTTGVPLVDAAMRELRSTGYIGNLARQFVASYFVDDLGLDWRVGADWFESTLVDYDPHVNWGQWARSAGVAPTNEAKRQRVGGTRYYDLAVGLPGGEAAQYIRCWVRELDGLTDDELFAPWRAQGGHGGTAGGYPQEPLCSTELRQYFEAIAIGGNKGRGCSTYSGGRGRGGQRGGGRSGAGGYRLGGGHKSSGRLGGFSSTA
eukprot:TRINITY_DN13176_c0_g1_i1.p1 TRINITY_DN13176_c0_g1~~TRINITY_DN13176_c0_g1_i1.p1  ORF type:complete len:852 (+),score=100.31 TRINITY_DN13176_c0_g1_i1:63-2558(+)